MPTFFDPASSLLIDDFDSFVHCLEGKPNLPLTAGGDLKAADLWAINDRVNYKAPDYVTNRSRQIDYPLPGFLFQVATVSRLFPVKFEKGNVLVANADRLDTYRNLTLEEKYIFLLETAWCYADWSAIDGDGRSGQGANGFQGELRQLLQNPVGTEATLFTRGWVQKGDPRTIHISATSNVYIRAGHWFGWYDIREVGPSKRNKYEPNIDRVTLTGWGQQCLTVLLRDRPFRHWNKHADDYAYIETGGPSGSMARATRRSQEPYRGAWTNSGRSGYALAFGTKDAIISTATAPRLDYHRPRSFLGIAPDGHFINWPAHPPP